MFEKMKKPNKQKKSKENVLEQQAIVKVRVTVAFYRRARVYATTYA